MRKRFISKTAGAVTKGRVWCRESISSLLAVVCLGGMASCAWGWGAGHGAITEGALATLPDWEKDMLGAERALLAQQHCVIPDQVYARKEVRKYAMIDSKPGVVYVEQLHLPATAPENFDLLRFFIGRAVEQFASGEIGEGARYAGTLVHALEDWGCPAHAVPGDNMFTLFKQFLPPPESQRHVALHGPMENAIFTVKLPEYRPRLLGATVDEAAFNLLHRVQQSTVRARVQVIPILRALYRDDTNAMTSAQQEAATFDAAVVADALHTVLCLARKRFDPEDVQVLRQVDLSARISLEATNLALPQSSFFSKPYWGHALRGITLREGKEPVPLRLRVGEAGRLVERQFDAGMGVGTRSVLTYLVPEGIYQRFETIAGLHAELGATGNVILEVLANRKSVVKVGPITGKASAQRLVVPLAGVTNLQLVATSGGGDGQGNYAVWAEPKLLK